MRKFLVTFIVLCVLGAFGSLAYCLAAWFTDIMGLPAGIAVILFALAGIATSALEWYDRKDI